MSKQDTVKRLNNFVDSRKFELLDDRTQSRFIELQTRLTPARTVLPGEQRTEEAIARRTPAMDILKEETDLPFKGGLGERAVKSVVTGAKAANVPLQTLESTLSAPQLLAQDPDFLEKRGFTTGESLVESQPTQESTDPRLAQQFTPPTASEFTEKVKEQASSSRAKTSDRIEGIKDLFKEAGKGFRQERIAEFGDPSRRAIPGKGGEVAGAVFGLAQSGVVVDKLLFGAVSNMLRNVDDVIKFKGPIVEKSTAKLLTQVDDVFKSLIDTRKILGKNIRKLFDSPVGKKVVTGAQSIVDDLPKIVIRNLRKKEFGIKFIDKTKGLIDDTAENVWKVRLALDDMLSVKDFANKITKTKNKLIKNGRTQLKDALRFTDDIIDDVMEKYHVFAESAEPLIDKFTNKFGQTVEKPFRLLFKGGSEARLRVNTQKLIDNFPTLLSGFEETVKSAIGTANRIALTKSAKGAASTMAKFALARKILVDPLQKSIKNSGGGGTPLEASGGGN